MIFMASELVEDFHFPVIIRDATNKDKRFIRPQYLSARNRGKLVGTLGQEHYEKLMVYRYCEYVRRKARMLVAANPELPRHIYGFLISEAPFVHFIYVDEPVRRIGIASLLLHKSGLKPPFIASHWNDVCEKVDDRNPGLLIGAPL